MTIVFFRFWYIKKLFLYGNYIRDLMTFYHNFGDSREELKKGRRRKMTELGPVVTRCMTYAPNFILT